MSAFSTYIAMCRKCGSQNISLCRENNNHGSFVGFYFICHNSNCGDETSAVMLTKDVAALIDWKEMPVTVKV